MQLGITEEQFLHVVEELAYSVELQDSEHYYKFDNK